MFQTLRFRLTFWHALTFASMALVVFGIAYQTTANQLLMALSEDLQDTAMEFSDLYQTGGISALRRDVKNEVLSHNHDRFFARYINANGQTMMVNKPSSWSLPLPSLGGHQQAMQGYNITINNRGDKARVLAVHSYDNGWIQVGMSLQDYHTQLQKIIQVFGWSLLVVVAVGILAGWLQIRHVLSSVDQVRRTAMEIGDGDLDRRLVLDGHGKELVDLANVFNAMLDRIQQLLSEMRHVSDHIAHDLRTPVTRLRGIAESSLIDNQSTADTKHEALAEILEECDRLSAMINTMLEIAQTNSGLTHLGKNIVDLSVLLIEAHELFLPVAEDADIGMVIHTNNKPLKLIGDAGRLQRLIANLLDNAIKFTPAGGCITCSTHKVHSTLELVIADTGVGIAEDALPHIFERFYRADNSRSTPGNGLGLSYAQSVARAHGGEIHIASQYGQGTTVKVSLPI